MALASDSELSLSGGDASDSELSLSAGDLDSGEHISEEVIEEDDDTSEGEQDGEDYDIAASATESDEEDEPAKESALHCQADRVTENIVRKYKERQGKQLYVRFPTKLPVEEDQFQQKAKSLSTLIVRAHRPRQKHARFCLVDFNSTDDRNAALKNMMKAIQEDENFKGMVVSIPHTENVEFVQKLVDKKLNSMETKKAKRRLKRASKQAMRSQNFTSSIVVLNLPKSASMSETKKLFPNAVDIQIKAGKGKLNGACVATVTLSSTKEARAAVKRSISVGGTQLTIRFDTKKLIQDKRKNVKRKLEDESRSNKKNKVDAKN